MNLGYELANPSLMGTNWDQEDGVLRRREHGTQSARWWFYTGPPSSQLRSANSRDIAGWGNNPVEENVVESFNVDVCIYIIYIYIL